MDIITERIIATTDITIERITAGRIAATHTNKGNKIKTQALQKCSPK